MELHERWLAELRSESMKHKLALAEGKITNEEYMDNVNKEIDLSILTIKEVYELRSQAKKDNNKPLLDKIHLFLNGRSGGFLHTANQLEKTLDVLQLSGNLNRRYGAIGRERKFIEAGKLIQGNENVLVLVPHGTPEDLNTNSIRFWDLQDVLNNADFQENPNEADLKDPQYTLMDPTFEELRDPASLAQQELKKADIILSLNSYGQWVIMKTSNQELDNNYLWVLKVPEVALDELFVNNPKEVWVYVDHRLGYTNDCENLYHAFAERLSKVKPDVKLHLMSGHPPTGWLQDKEIVLMAGRFEFFVKQALKTPHVAKVVPFGELTGPDSKLHQHLYFGQTNLTAQCRAEFSRESVPDINVADAYPKPGELLDPNDDPGQFYRSGFGNEPLLPHEVPGQAYALSAQAEEARVQLELTEMSIKRFGYILVDPKTGLTVSKEEQDKHVQAILDAANSRKK